MLQYLRVNFLQNKMTALQSQRPNKKQKMSVFQFFGGKFPPSTK